MTGRSALFSANILALAALMTAGGSPPAQALSMKECSIKYKAAQAAGILSGMTWSEFRRAQCGGDASSAVTPTAKAAAAASAIFPNSVSSKYSNETPGKARMHTCRDQYNANKATNGNGGLIWIQKGGGYYSECNKRLKS